MDTIIQFLLALGSPAFEGLIAMLGGPKLVINEPIIDHRPFILPTQSISESCEHTPSGGTIPQSYLDVMRREGQKTRDDYSNKLFILIPILNQQKSRIPNSTAKKVYAKLHFFDLDEKPISGGIEFDGRWERSNQPSAYENLEELRFIDILPEDKQNLDIATRGVRGGFWFIWNNDSYKSNEYPENKLKENGFIFSLELSGENIFKKYVCYKFLSVGKSGKPEFSRFERKNAI